MKKRSILLTALALVLVAGISIGGTMAYFQAESEDLVNTFTVGNVDISLNEPTWFAPGGSDIAADMTPSQKANKDPFITNESDSNACYARLRITGLSYDATSDTLAAPMGFAINDLDLTNWDIVQEGANIYAYYKSILDAGDSTPELFSGITMTSTALEGDVAGFSITIVGEAIQCEGALAPLSTETEAEAAIRAFESFVTPV